MKGKKPIHIIGGGLAGLTLGIALRRERIPVRITEAGTYPRHRVCGEFISGAGQQVLASLGLEETLKVAATNNQTTWFSGNRTLFSGTLPFPARGISRFYLDCKLAERFRDLRGELVTGSIIRPMPDQPGTIWACGRSGSSRTWIGLKLHCRGLTLPSDLSMHLGTNGYVGVSRIEDEKVNVCGLFRHRPGLSPGKERILIGYLRANGLHDLAEKIEAAEIDPDSISATTALNFTSSPWPEQAACIGDANTAIPPFTGNGMSMAFESARLAAPLVASYSQEEISWSATRETLKKQLRRLFRPRTTAARFLHPFLLWETCHGPLSWAVEKEVLPFSRLYRLLR